MQLNMVKLQIQTYLKCFPSTEVFITHICKSMVVLFLYQLHDT